MGSLLPSRAPETHDTPAATRFAKSQVDQSPMKRVVLLLRYHSYSRDIGSSWTNSTAEVIDFNGIWIGYFD